MSERFPFRPLALAMLLWVAVPGWGWAEDGASDAPPVEAGAAAASTSVAQLLRGTGLLQIAGRNLDRATLTLVYDRHEFRPIWAGGRDETLLEALAGATGHGIDPSLFAVPESTGAERDLLLTDAFLRYAAALGKGRVPPASLEGDWFIPAPDVDGAGVLERALEGATIASALAELAPSRPEYQRLRQALERYRGYAKARSWEPLEMATPINKGERSDRVRQLRQRFAAEGFLANPEGDSFDSALEAAVKRFQILRGLPIDGSVGAGTLDALNVTPEARVHQIEVNLERWRTLPRDWAPTRVEVNIPAQQMALFEDGAVSLEMKTVVGDVTHHTPVLRARISAVLFNPPWNVPTSILKKEIRPALRRDPHYLEKNGYVFVENKNGVTILQQVPGPKNSLGRIKFEMPNPEDVYLHDTPMRQFFARARRALSHGCIRLEEPRELARHLLAARPNWSLQAIDDAIAAGDTRSVDIPHAVPVYLLYFTAFVGTDGAPQFRDDIYGRDGRLTGALAARDAVQPLVAAPQSPTAVASKG